MLITINEILGDGSVVRFSYESGHADGVWRGDHAPSVGPVDVEWEIGGRFYWGDDLRLWEENSFRVVQDPEAFSIAGIGAAIDDKGVMTLRIGESAVAFQTAGPAPKNLVGSVVEVDGPLIELFPIG